MEQRDRDRFCSNYYPPTLWRKAEPHKGTNAARLFERRRMARVTGLEPATSGVTGRRSNQLSYTRLLKRGGGH